MRLRRALGWIWLTLAAMSGRPAQAVVDVMGNVKQNGFGPRLSVLADFCSPGQLCTVADFSGDGRADLVALDPLLHRVRFARNVFGGYGYSVTQQRFAAVDANRAFAWGDADLDRRDDLFVCDTLSGRASLFLTTASATLETTARPVANDFCRPGEQFRVGDVDGDGRVDAVRFQMSATAPEGRVTVALNAAGAGFLAPTEWQSFFGIGDEQVSVADLDGNGKDDVVTCVPGAGAFVALSDGSRFVGSRRPRVGIGSAAALPQLTDLALPGQTCLTGDFDGGKKQDLVVFAGGVGNFVDDFHDTRGDVYVSLSHTVPDFTDFYRVGRPRIRHEDFCRAGEQCAVGDLDGDGKDDIVSFAHGVGGDNQVNIAFSRWGAPTAWSLDLTRISARVTEGSGDKPLVLALGFRSTFGAAGSTVITRNAYDETFATGIVAGGRPVSIPPPVGRFPFGFVRLRTVDNLLNQSLEVFGVLVVVMEKDLSAAAAYSGLLDEAERALRAALVTLVERRPVLAVATGGGFLPGGIASLRAGLGANIVSAVDDILHLVVSGLLDPDDYINLHVAVFPAIDKEAYDVLPASGDDHSSVAVPGEGAFGQSLGRMPFDDEDSPLAYDIDALFR